MRFRIGLCLPHPFGVGTQQIVNRCAISMPGARVLPSKTDVKSLFESPDPKECYFYQKVNICIVIPVFIR